MWGASHSTLTSQIPQFYRKIRKNSAAGYFGYSREARGIHPSLEGLNIPSTFLIPQLFIVSINFFTKMAAARK
jgi:hypothetical protein